MTKAQDEWTRCKHWVAAAAKRGPFPEPMGQVEAKIASGEYQFWPGATGAVVTEVGTFNGHKTLIAVHGGGNLDEIVNRQEPALCAVAKAMGCTHIAGIGRLGYKKIWEKRGYKFAWLMMVKDIQ